VDWLLFGLRLLATTILYTFLGLAFYLIWRSLKQAQSAPAPRYQLRVLAAPADSALAVGDELALQSITHVGRDPTNTIVVGDGGASARHARLSRDNGLWWLEDLGSRNGTLLNDLPLAKPASLAEGDVIAIGAARFRFEAELQGGKVAG